jgi:Protein of unknown function (DUF3592)
MLSDQALLWTAVAAAVCALLAAGLLYSVVRTRRRIAASRSWPVVQGEIVQSEVEVPAAHDSDDATDCTAKIRYRYRVGDKDYESDCVQPGGTAMRRRLFAEELVARYPLGACVDVTLDPRAPEQAVLEPRNTENLVATAVFFVAFVAIATVLAAHALAGKVLTTPGGLPMFAFLLPVAAILLGAFCVVYFAKMRRQARASAAWPFATGKITRSAVARDVLAVKDDDTGRIRYDTKYRPVVNFNYCVDGRDYYGSGVSGGWTSLHDSPERAEAVVAAYPAGKEIAIYYDPEQPRTAVLERGKAAGGLTPLVVGAVFSLCGVLMLWGLASVG